MNKSNTSLSKTEWSLMRLCWNKGKASARVIYEESLKEKSRGYQTVKTMLDRMTVKGYLNREKFGPIWLYEPAISSSSAVASEIDSFVSTVLDNTVAPLFAHFAKRENLSQREITALKKLIVDYEEEK